MVLQYPLAYALLLTTGENMCSALADFELACWRSPPNSTEGCGGPGDGGGMAVGGKKNPS